MTLPSLPVPPSGAAARPLPARSWPVWLIFGVLLVPALLSLALFAGAEDDAAERVDFQNDAVGRSLVLTGELAGTDTSSGLPVNTGQYEVTIPDAEGGAGEILTIGADENWGFPPSEDHPSELSFLIVLDDQPRAVAHGPVGSIAEVTEESVRAAQNGLATAQGVRVAGIVVFWVYLVGTPALGVILAVRRGRAKRRASATGWPVPVI